ncbi:MAG: TonB family protein [Verrucomicrobia bacterium]|jgi:protein TonB|nr:TonB family protein [Verrucomicrobiota bacterium]
MSQLQRKCVLASAGLHGLLFLVLLIGPAFMLSHDKLDDQLPTLDIIPARLIDEPFYRLSSPGPSPKPAVATPAPPQPPAPQTVKTPEPKPDAPKAEAKSDPAPEPKYTRPEEIKVNLKPKAGAAKPKPRPTGSSPSRPDYASAAKAIRSATSSTSIEMPSLSSGSLGGGGPGYANYAQAVRSIYERNWFPPEESSREDALVKVEVVIARDGTILSSRVIGRCGDAAVDASVEATLRRVTEVPAFPESAKDSRRTYIIGFNLKARRAMG